MFLAYVTITGKSSFRYTCSASGMSTNDRELIIQKADELCQMLKEKIENNKLDIGYIDGANHSYTGKEEILANEIQNFLREIVE